MILGDKKWLMRAIKYLISISTAYFLNHDEFRVDGATKYANEEILLHSSLVKLMISFTLSLSFKTAKKARRVVRKPYSSVPSPKINLMQL